MFSACVTLTILSAFTATIASDDEIVATVKGWADDLGKELGRLTSVTRRNKVKDSFSQVKIEEENWDVVVEEIAKNIKKMMDEKVDAVKAIKRHVELLSLNRKRPIMMNSTFDFYDSGNITNTNNEEDRSEDLKIDEELWKCSVPENARGLCFSNTQKPQSDQPVHSYDSETQDFDSFNYKPRVEEVLHSNPIRGRCSHTAFLRRPEKYYRTLPMEYNPHFDAEVNLNYSTVRLTPTVFSREFPVLNGIRMTQPLDLTFKCNYEKDPTLTYQYFGSPKGYMRLYPGIKWSEEKYATTFDFRLRSWFVEGMTHAKDIVILVDRSGSMNGTNRVISTSIVNTILDTLTDNDYVNIYTFTNTTEPLVNCFNDVLVQANEENLRLLREQLPNIHNEFCGDISLGLEVAFPLLWNYREARRGGKACNQAIMLITEGLDYDYNHVIFEKYNHIPSQKYYRPIRVFTYLLGTEPNDAQRMKWIACANMGYFVNITEISEVREKVLKYLEIMSRPINLKHEDNPQPAWTHLYVHLADRRLSNWLWRKNEGNRQRDTLINYEVGQIRDKSLIMKESHKHFTKTTSHDYEQYLKPEEYKYLTSVSLPVYDLRPNQTVLLGVAGVDVSLAYIRQLTEPHRIGVNGYAFIITNNGYVLYHPDHRTEFTDGILKPTFSRVDFTEVEISDETIEPRTFDDAIIKLRNDIVLQKKFNRKLRVRVPIDNMKRVLMHSRHYFLAKIGPFTLGIALPDKYGFLVVRHLADGTKITKQSIISHLKGKSFWKVHPKWLYTCKIHRTHKSPEDELLHFIENTTTRNKPDNCDVDLLNALVRDVKLTEWFDSDDIQLKSSLQEELVLTFLATHAGLTRWKNFIDLDNITRHFAEVHNKGPDEIYYRRSAEINFEHPDVFIYSVPFEGYDENVTLVTASNVIFQEKEKKRAPVAAVGFQIFHSALNSLLYKMKCKSSSNCKVSCNDGNWRCFVLDNDGYVVLHNNTDFVGKSLRQVDVNLMKQLVEDGVYREITVFDYQATCYPEFTGKEESSFYGFTVEQARSGKAKCDPTKKSEEVKCKTIEFLKLKLKKTTPTPCDQEIKMYNFEGKTSSMKLIVDAKSNCKCRYLSEYVKGTNLVLLVASTDCCASGKTEEVDEEAEYPLEIKYNMTLPCFIAKMNNFTKRSYLSECLTKDEKEFVINVNNENCGGEGITPIE